MLNRKKVFITISFADVSGIFDYPKHLPIPRENETVHFNELYGKVNQVKHMTSGNVTEISIICSRL